MKMKDGIFMDKVCWPFGDIVNELGKDEEMLIVNIDKKEINKARSLPIWVS